MVKQRVASSDDAFIIEPEPLTLTLNPSPSPTPNQVPLEQKVAWWHERYKPRKPKYFNRVHTGYEWNKYNQTHYDHDNPPPKMVQGYKFNVFFPGEA